MNPEKSYFKEKNKEMASGINLTILILKKSINNDFIFLNKIWRITIIISKYILNFFLSIFWIRNFCFEFGPKKLAIYKKDFDIKEFWVKTFDNI